MKLIILNGPCGVGKSSIATRLHQALPLSFLLDIDSLRRLFSTYKEKREESREASLKLAETMMSACLDMGHDVIIDKMQFDTDVLDRYHEIAKQRGAEMKEVILWASREIVMARASARGYKKGSAFTPEKCELFWHKINELKDKRPSAIVIDTTDFHLDETYDLVIKAITDN